MAIDPRARVPAAIGLVRVVDSDGDQVRVSELYVGCEVVEKWHVSVRTAAEKVSIDPHLAELVNAVELEGELFIFVGIWDAELLAIPADAGGKIRTAITGGRRFVEAAFNAPIVRQIQSSPVCVRKFGQLQRPEQSLLPELPTRGSKLSRILCATVSDPDCA